MAATYYKIADYTVTTSGIQTFNFNSIPQTYTDLVLLSNVSTSSQTRLGVRFNGDTATNYYEISSEGSSSAIFNSNSTRSYANGAWITDNSTSYAGCGILQIHNYAETNKKKPYSLFLGLYSTAVTYGTGTWNSTSAITSMTIYNPSANDFRNGCVFSLYGIARV